MPDFLRIYARQEYLTPGAAGTVELIAEAVRPAADALLLEVAAGKAEAACTLAGRFACRVLAVELYDPFVQYAAAKAWHWNLRDLVTVLRADGRRLPLRGAACDAAYCIGAPSIVGLEPCLAEMARAVSPGGHVVVSDIVWRRKPEQPLGPEWKWVASAEPKLSAEEYAAAIQAAGLRVERVHIHDRSAWEAYWRPMLRVAEEAKTSQPADIAFADELESGVELERRAVEAWLDYATFIARRP
ncbi:MAG: class I SAM-dependent methyltransferase [Dehalococcoidia bacterium]|nr:class I SAM-dependent methyltransferase [Dehalococcoidia bacterium]